MKKGGHDRVGKEQRNKDVCVKPPRRKREGDQITLEKLANMADCLGFTAKEMTGAGTNMLVNAYLTVPSVKESIEEQSTPNMAHTSPALMLSISSS